MTRNDCKVYTRRQCKSGGVGVVGTSRQEAVTATLSAMSAMSKIVRRV
jgi:hypothetical protein